MGDSKYLHPVALTWSQGPQKLKKLKNKLQLYFGSKSKSDGGECEIRDPDCTRGYILIHYKEETARDRVLQRKTHELKLPDGTTLQLEVRLPEDIRRRETPPPPQDKAGDCKSEKRQKLSGKPTLEKEVPPNPPSSPVPVLIENIQDSFTPEILNLLVENISDRSMDTDFYIERIPEIQSAVITFTCDTDIADFIGKFSGSPRVKQHKITAKSLEETRSVRVEGIPPDTPEEMVTLYLESARNGGGDVEDVTMLSDEGAALVTFHQAGVVKTVMTKQHVLNNKTISVYPYYPSIGHCLYGKDGPHIQLPNSVEIPISPHILAFILKDEQIKRNVEKLLADVSCDITWPNVDQPTPVIKLSLSRNLSSHLRTLAKIVPTWSDNVHRKFYAFISKYKAAECDLKPPVWEAIKEKMSSPQYDGVLIKPDLAVEKAFIVGISEDVKKIEPIFRKLVEETTRQLSRVEEEVPLEPEAYKLMEAHGLEKSILEESPHVKISYDGTSKAVKLCGPRDEVLTAKCEILNNKQGLNYKFIQLDAHIIKFLKAVDNGELSCSLLMKNNIKAAFQVKDNEVMLTGYSDKELRNGEETVKKELACKRISVEDKSVTESPEWRNLKSFLKEMFNTNGVTVSIEEFPVRDGAEVVITGLSSPAEETYQQIHDFVEKNTLVEKDIKLKSMAVLQFMEEKRKPDWNGIIQNVKVAKKQNFISLSGSKFYVEEAETSIGKMISKIYPHTLYINKPGAKKSFIENEDMYVTTVWNKHKCVMHLQKEVDDRISHLNELHCQVSLQNGATMVIYKGDLYKHNADVIIIASNENLKPTGGPALALVKAAGPGLQKECDHIVKKKGALKPGECVMTDVSNLPCKKVIHAVAPKLDKKGNSKCDRLLRKVITESLEKAAEIGQSSVALSLGDFVTSGASLDLFAQNIVKSIKSYAENQEGANTIKNIHLVDSDEGVLKTITEFLNEEFEDKHVQVPFKHGMKKKKTTPKKERVNKPNDQMVTTKEGLNINIKQGNIEDATTNVVVNSVGTELNLRSGAVSKALFGKAGANLQDLLTTERQGKQVEDGSIFVTDGCNLSCDIVIHAVVPEWDGGKGSSEKILRKILIDCLSTAETKQYGSITIPAIGTGVLEFPRNIVAASMYEEILEFSSKNQPKYLKKVDFMLHPSDPETIKAFSSELEKKIGTGGQKKDIKPQSFFGNVKSPAQNVYEMKIGSLTYQVKIGDITKEKCDVIVNSTNNTFNLKSGVSKAILEGAGPGIENECAILGTQPNNGYVVTQAGNLHCKNIVHATGQTKPDSIGQCVTNVLHMCERQRATSVAFPAMGTGAGGVSSAPVADAILDAVVDFAKSKSAMTVQHVTMVIFQQPMLKDFHTSMTKKEPPPAAKQTSFFSWITSNIFGTSNKKNTKEEEEEEDEVEEPKVFELRENIEPAIIHLCAERQESVKAASDYLQGLATKDQHDNTIADPWIQDLDDKDHGVLVQLQRDNGVYINFDSPQSTIQVTGLTKDVLEVSNKIQAMIKGVRDRKTREREAEMYSNVVEWGHYQGTNFIPFDKMTNSELEKAFTNNSAVDVHIAGVKYKAIAERKTALDPKGKTIKLHRNPKNAESLVTPPYWDKMDNTQLKVVPLTSSNSDYSEVEGLFTQSCQMRIIKIERIQNTHLHQNYQIKKNSIDTKNGNKNNEKRLFHGTDSATTDYINHNGFNRAYAGANAALLGKGTYFAADAIYSADDTYSKPDTNKYKYMYLVRVLTGVYCVGNAAMIIPPAKSPSNPTDLYDSATDNIATPSVFVIFNDVQAYPEYLITFTK
ncbi:protein mono-ADP-ribosyltransferase PARP14-like [Rana temporaria]|uniref:protein mono-ADP-ribosyltransferase PARP14-like n=1 Tax=Rana temporaria TaxID=8407 RepID=UPI001AADDF38|nr:protein mono-ADP-ribosyltransferase PARP14-like [Rana temporaria]